MLSGARAGTLGLVIAVVLGAAASATAAPRCPATLTPELMAPYVEGIQRQLLQLGYNPGRNDGKMGERTTAAIRAYQRAAGLRVDGCPSQDLLNQMSFTPAPASSREGRRNRGDAVAASPSPALEVQRLLTDKGYTLGPVDGVTGGRTRAALQAFQQRRHLPVTGVADDATLAELRRPGR